MIEILSDHFELLPERCVFHRERRTILCSDLHWGKAESLQRRGLAIPSSHMHEDLSRLDRAVRKTKAERVIVLGDLIHTPSSMQADLINEIAKWRSGSHALTFAVIRGNHDRQHPWPEAWHVQDLGTAFKEGSFVFSHDRVETPDAFVWTGHVHPMIRLKAGGDSLRLPCFLIGEREGILPAFTSLAGGWDVEPEPGQRVFAIADEDVVEI